MHKVSKLAEMAFITKCTMNYYTEELLVHFRLIEALKQRGRFFRNSKQQLENTSPIENKSSFITTSLRTNNVMKSAGEKGVLGNVCQKHSHVLVYHALGVILIIYRRCLLTLLLQSKYVH
ncbi:hypothetical protein CHN50_11575 [Priestia aryabhattai]|nr:hypothetical protein CHN50_11575 [Priestia aryabhattai]